MSTRPKTLWFKAKRYGWGWYPVTWQGYLSTLLFTLTYILLVTAYMGWLSAATMAGGADYRGLSLGTLEFLAAFAAVTWLMIVLCTRYGERPRWRWGKDTD